MSRTQSVTLPPHLLTAPQVAQILGVSPQWVYKHAQAGTLPFIHLTDSPRSPLRADSTDVDAWLNKLKDRAVVQA
jgi:predicted DNA-binding transcriptional regulator AlpA